MRSRTATPAGPGTARVPLSHHCTDRNVTSSMAWRGRDA